MGYNDASRSTTATLLILFLRYLSATTVPVCYTDSAAPETSVGMKGLGVSPRPGLELSRRLTLTCSGSVVHRI